MHAVFKRAFTELQQERKKEGGYGNPYEGVSRDSCQRKNPCKDVDK